MPATYAPDGKPPSSGPLPVYRALVGLGVLCGLLITAVVQGTQPAISRHHKEALQRAVLDVLPGAVSRQSLRWDAQRGLVPAEADDEPARLVHAGFDASGALIGVAVPAHAMGYQDTIHVLYGYHPGAERVIGLRVLASRETPGLGDRIASDAAFLAGFRALELRLNEGGNALQRRPDAVRQGADTRPWEFEAITGATVSSRAVAEALASSASHWLPKLRNWPAGGEHDEP